MSSEVGAICQTDGHLKARTKIGNHQLNSKHICSVDGTGARNSDVSHQKATLLPQFSEPSFRCPNSYVYSTRCVRRGCCIVLSFDKFDPILCLQPRRGSLVDIHNVEKAFTILGFNVMIYSNLDALTLISTLREIANLDHKDCDNFACVILTHGDENGFIYATDKAVALDQLISVFRGDRCQDLCGKPKLFFVQACRGSSLDGGVMVCDGPSSKVCNMPSICRIPIEADLLIAYAVQPGYYAFRNSCSGSWFIRALSDCLLRYGHTLDLVSILTRVNYTVAYDYESIAADPAFCGKKQMPSIVSTLTKLVIFPPKGITNFDH